MPNENGQQEPKPFKSTTWFAFSILFFLMIGCGTLCFGRGDQIPSLQLAGIISALFAVIGIWRFLIERQEKGQ